MKTEAENQLDLIRSRFTTKNEGGRPTLKTRAGHFTLSKTDGLIYREEGVSEYHGTIGDTYLETVAQFDEFIAEFND